MTEDKAKEVFDLYYTLIPLRAELERWKIVTFNSEETYLEMLNLEQVTRLHIDNDALLLLKQEKIKSIEEEIFQINLKIAKI